MTRYAVLILMLLTTSLLSHAQHKALKPYSWDEFVQEILDGASVEEDEEASALANINEGQLRELEDMHNHPFSLPMATEEQLAQLPFLDDEAIDQIMTYIRRHKGIAAWGELVLIPYLSTEMVKALPLFCTLEKAPENGEKRQRKTKHEISSRMEIPLYYRKGFLAGSLKGGGRAYAGDLLYHNMRYKMESRHVDVGVHTEKDPGETFYDSYGGYVRLHDYGMMKEALLGDFRIGFGEGLVLGSYGYGKSALTMRTAQGTRPQTGMSEAGFMRGAALTLGEGQWTGTFFVAYNTMDGTLSSADSTAVQTVVTSGLHRTAAERAKKGNLHEFVTGGHLQWENKHWYVGMTGYYSRMDKELLPYAKPTLTNIYRDIFPRGNHWGIIGTNYGYKSYRWTFAGETALATEHADVATVNRVAYSHSRNLQLAVVGRYYGDRYYSRYSAALSENSRDQNETGILLRVTARPADAWVVQAYVDFFYFHWPRYGQTSSDAGQDFMAQATWTVNQRHTLMMRYQLKRKELRDIMQNNHVTKVQWTWNANKNIRFSTTGNIHGLATTQKGRLGWGIMENIRGLWLKERLTGSLAAGYFCTDDYDARVYLYEPALWNASSYNTYYGKGMRLALALRWQEKHWMVEAKYGMTHYLDRETIGTGQQMIFAPTKQDVSVQMRIRL